MYIYYVGSVGDFNRGMRLKLGVGQYWETFEPGAASIWVHPGLDYHAIWGSLFLQGKHINLMECPPNHRIEKPGSFILALNHKDARELIRP